MLKWMKRFKVKLSSTPTEGKDEATEQYVKMINKNDKAEASKFAEGLIIRGGKLLRRIEFIKKT